MKIVRTKAEIREVRVPRLGFVPTMGAFHEGHLALMRQAKAECGVCAVSLFVNPTQFGPNEDYQKYPRQEALDFAMAAEAGVDVMFAPSADEMYEGSVTKVNVGELATLWEGAHRPGHFDGVATIVAKLFHLVGPDVAYFGLKDFQQCAVLRRMVADLDFPVELRFVETVREPDGLAMSSRNAYLSGDERSVAASLFATLQDLRKSITADPFSARRHLRTSVENLENLGFQVDYLEWVDGTTLKPIDAPQENARLIVAAKLGKTRLIDNCAL